MNINTFIRVFLEIQTGRMLPSCLQLQLPIREPACDPAGVSQREVGESQRLVPESQRDYRLWLFQPDLRMVRCVLFLRPAWQHCLDSSAAEESGSHTQTLAKEALRCDRLNLLSVCSRRALGHPRGV